MKSLLAGATGFVGSSISRSSTFSAYANSKNFADFAGDHFDLVVFSAAPAVKWWANANSEADAVTIKNLMSILRSISAKRFVLISTIDVYPSPEGVDEHNIIDENSGTPYGRNRKWLEDQVRAHFPVHHVLRLPGLFGPGLKKNVLFDLVRGNMLNKINVDSSFQWYPLTRIWSDIQRVITAELDLVNMATEPVSTGDIVQNFFPSRHVGGDPAPTVAYNVKTAFSRSLAGTSAGYILDSRQVLSEIERWLRDPKLNYA